MKPTSPTTVRTAVANVRRGIPKFKRSPSSRRKET
jgi:hypothetical protein